MEAKIICDLCLAPITKGKEYWERDSEVVKYIHQGCKQLIDVYKYDLLYLFRRLRAGIPVDDRYQCNCRNR